MLTQYEIQILNYHLALISKLKLGPLRYIKVEGRLETREQKCSLPITAGLIMFHLANIGFYIARMAQSTTQTKVLLGFVIAVLAASIPLRLSVVKYRFELVNLVNNILQINDTLGMKPLGNATI